MNMELVREKWRKTGLLELVRPENIDAVVARLENAAQLALNTHNHLHLEKEIRLMRDQGLFDAGEEQQKRAQLTEDRAVLQLGEALKFFKANGTTLDQVLSMVKVAWHAGGQGA